MQEAQFNHELDNLNRTAKLFLDRGEAGTFEESNERLHAYRLHADYRSNNAAMQIALLTFVNTSCRFALGGVTVSGELDVPLRVPLPGFRTLGEAVIALGGQPSESSQDVPTVIYGAASPRDPERAIRIVTSGWAGGIAPANMSLSMSSKPVVASAAVLAGAIAAGEGFSLLAGDSVMAGRRLAGLSLWQPERIDDWLSADVTGPQIIALPNDFWLLGLGHLGQAFLWTVMVSPYRNPADVRFVLQDFDSVTGSTLSTSILSTQNMIGQMKTRAMSDLLEERGFRTMILERHFDGAIARRPEDPLVFICCVDNAAARRAIEKPNFPIVIESGIGRTEGDFRSLRLHTFPSNRKAQEIWSMSETDDADAFIESYDALKSQGLDQCGLAQLANTAVGAPFVGAAAGPLMYAQLLRLLHGKPLHSVVDVDLTDLKRRRMIANEQKIPTNPGFAEPGDIALNAA